MPARAQISVAAAAGLDGDSPRLLSTASFLKEVGVAGGLRKEVQGFAERWIYGRGTPHIRAAFQWHRWGSCRSCEATASLVALHGCIWRASRVQGPSIMAIAPARLLGLDEAS